MSDIKPEAVVLTVIDVREDFEGPWGGTVTTVRLAGIPRNVHSGDRVRVVRVEDDK